MGHLLSYTTYRLIRVFIYLFIFIYLYIIDKVEICNVTTDNILCCIYLLEYVILKMTTNAAIYFLLLLYYLEHKTNNNTTKKKDINEVQKEHEDGAATEADEENAGEFDDEAKHYNPDGVSEAPHKIQ